MGAFRRLAFFVYAFATILGVGYLALLWFSWEPLMPAAGWLAGQQWFFVFEAVLLGIVLAGTLVVLVRAIAAPPTASRLRIERDAGTVDIARDAIVSTARDAVESHRGLAVKDVHVKIVGKRDPRVRLRMKVDPGRSGMLEQLGSRLTDEVAASVNALTGHPLDSLRISFAKPDGRHASRTSAVAVAAASPAAPISPTEASAGRPSGASDGFGTTGASESVYAQAAPNASVAPEALSFDAEDMADEAVAGAEGASFNTVAAMSR